MYESILVPLDGSEYAAKAVGHAAALAGDAKQVTLLTVIHTVGDLFGKQEAEIVSDSEMTDEDLARHAYEREYTAAQQALQEAKKAFAGTSAEVRTELAEGAPADHILRVAGEVKADLVVITAYGHTASTTPSQTGIFGSVADAVLKNSKAPVLVVKPFS